MEEDDEEGWEHIEIHMDNDVEADTTAIIQMAACMLNGDGTSTLLRALELPLASVASTLTMAASMVAALAEHLAEHEDRSTEQVLLELRNWMNESGEEEDG